MIAHISVAQSFVQATNKICWNMSPQLFVRLIPCQWHYIRMEGIILYFSLKFLISVW